MAQGELLQVKEIEQTHVKTLNTSTLHVESLKEARQELLVANVTLVTDLLNESAQIKGFIRVASKLSLRWTELVIV